MDQARGIGGRGLQGAGQTETTVADDVRDGAIHTQCGSREFLRSGQHHAVIRRKVDLKFAEPVSAWSGSRGGCGVCYENRTLHAFGPQSRAQERAVEMNAISDKTCAEAILRKLIPKAVREFRHQPARGVTKMGGEGGARVDCGGDLICARPSMADTGG